MSLAYAGENCRPPSPVHLRAELWGGFLEISWVRRSRYGWNWVDEIDAPLGESVERYRVAIEGAEGSLSLEVAEPQASIAATQLAALGPGTASITVRQVGDRGVSRPALALITIP